MKYMHILLLISVFLTLLLLNYGCKEKTGHGSGVGTIIENAQGHVAENKELESQVKIPADITLAQMEYQGGFFWVETRKDKIHRYNCSNCHTNKKVMISDAKEMAHGDISLKHGVGSRPLSCNTCHNQEDRNYLVSEVGKKIDFDHSYQLCGICHFRQKKDWIGGAHGKRITYWAGKRVIKSCTGCHSPHTPKFSARWPKTYSRPIQ